MIGKAREQGLGVAVQHGAQFGICFLDTQKQYRRLHHQLIRVCVKSNRTAKNPFMLGKVSGPCMLKADGFRLPIRSGHRACQRDEGAEGHFGVMTMLSDRSIKILVVEYRLSAVLAKLKSCPVGPDAVISN